MRDGSNTIMLTNDLYAAHADPVDRRYCALATTDTMSGIQTEEKKRYFDQIGSVPAKLVAKLLYSRDISKFNPRMFPQTEFLQDQKERRLESVDSWWLYQLNHPFNDGDDDDFSSSVLSKKSPATVKLSDESDEKRKPILKDRVYDMYMNHPNFKNKYIETSSVFWRQMKKLTLFKEIRKDVEGDPRRRPASILFGKLQHCRKQWTEYTQHESWMFEDTDAEEASNPSAPGLNFDSELSDSDSDSDTDDTFMNMNTQSQRHWDIIKMARKPLYFPPDYVFPEWFVNNPYEMNQKNRMDEDKEDRDDMEAESE